MVAVTASGDDLFDMHTAQSVKQTLEGSKKPMPNGEQITRHVAKIPRREFTTSLLHPLAIIVKQPRTADTAWRSTFLENRLFTEFAWTDLPL